MKFKISRTSGEIVEHPDITIEGDFYYIEINTLEQLDDLHNFFNDPIIYLDNARLEIYDDYRE